MSARYFVSLLIFLVYSFVVSSCSPKITNPLEYEGERISFGDGGGFAGIEHRYLILDNGQLYQHNRASESFARLRSADKNTIVQAFETYKMLNFTSIQINSPGNLYYFLDYQSEEGDRHRMVWGNEEVDDRVKILYRILSQVVKESKD